MNLFTTYTKKHSREMIRREKRSLKEKKVRIKEKINIIAGRIDMILSFYAEKKCNPEGSRIDVNICNKTNKVYIEITGVDETKPNNRIDSFGWCYRIDNRSSDKIWKGVRRILIRKGYINPKLQTADGYDQIKLRFDIRRKFLFW